MNALFVKLSRPLDRKPMHIAGITRLFFTPVALSLLACSSIAQPTGDRAQSAANSDLTLSVDASRHFLAAHGRRAVLQGYAAEGLSLWAYPLQIFDNYHVAFRPAGATAAIEGADIVSRVIYQPDAVTRVFLGPNFVAREKLLVPLDRAGAIITYSIQSSTPVEIEVHATPVMNLMWPAGAGGQYAQWNSTLAAFVFTEPADGFTAVLGSPQIVAHDTPDNRIVRGGAEAGIGFTLHPNAAGIAQVIAVLNPAHADDQGLLFHEMIRASESLQSQASAHVDHVRQSLLQITTPDDQLNRAIAWSEMALDQAWACNSDLGCAYLAGYGPSHGARRPQYEWFFAGDGMVAEDAAVTIGSRTQARDELEFILRYQNSKTGMIWHELSQSASLIDWIGKYPYMYVHVDITFQFLATVERYVAATGDITFARDHWKAIESAYRYCLSTIDPATALPRIPADKEGGNEQDRMSDDLGLSTSWVSAATSFAHLATLSGHASLAAQSAQAAERARAAIPTHYWDASRNFWIEGHTLGGKPMAEQSAGSAEALALHLFNPQQNTFLLDRLASASFQTDWGARSIAAGSAGFDPDSYSKGSVWTVGTATMAGAFWSEHRPVTALALWRAMPPLALLDSPGHMPEVLAGNFYRPQVESVPEQTWSSAGFLNATIHGLLGIQADSLANTLVFAPRLPAEWREVSVARIPLAAASLSLTLHRDEDGMTLEVDNSGPSFKLQFQPDIPLGATLRRATLNRHPIAASIESSAEQTEARATFDAPHGKSELRLDLQGGVSIIPDVPQPLLGDASSAMHIVGTSLNQRRLSIAADIPVDRASHLRLKTAWKIASSDGATVQTVAPGLVDLTFSSTQDASATYRRANATVEFVR